MPILVEVEVSIWQRQLLSLQHIFNSLKEGASIIGCFAEKRGGHTAVRLQSPLDHRHLPKIPARMDNPQAIQFQPQRQPAEPLEMVSKFVPRHLPQRLRMLVRVLLGVLTKVPSSVSRRWIRCVIRQRVEFMIAHNGERAARLVHSADQPHGFWNLRPAIHEVSDEDSRSTRMPERAVTLLVAKTIQQFDPLGCMSVNITHNVVQSALLVIRSTAG